MATHVQLAAYDDALRDKFGPCVAGVDEVGRGSWAGPLVAGCVIFKPGTAIKGLNDSKQLTEDKRIELEPIIKSCCAAWGIGIVSPQDIDSRGITAANIEAMMSAAKQATDMLNEKVHVYVVDQAPFFGLRPHVMIPKGDGTSLAVAAASVLAKVFRDQLMEQMPSEYDGYLFKENKGYINDAHVATVNKFGLSDIHRKSFKVKGFSDHSQMTMKDFLDL
jgi:ribonuclease HII